jgi:hypothetical protein
MRYPYESESKDMMRMQDKRGEAGNNPPTPIGRWWGFSNWDGSILLPPPLRPVTVGAQDGYWSSEGEKGYAEWVAPVLGHTEWLDANRCKWPCACGSGLYIDGYDYACPECRGTDHRDSYVLCVPKDVEHCRGRLAECRVALEKWFYRLVKGGTDLWSARNAYAHAQIRRWNGQVLSEIGRYGEVLEWRRLRDSPEPRTWLGKDGRWVYEDGRWVYKDE